MYLRLVWLSKIFLIKNKKKVNTVKYVDEDEFENFIKECIKRINIIIKMKLTELKI